MRKILVTGGAGYIGSKLVTKLLNLNFKVTVIDSLIFSSKSLNHLFGHKNFNFVKGDVRNKKIMKNLIKKNEFIIPLAALVGAPLCKKKKKEAHTTHQGPTRTSTLQDMLAAKKNGENGSYKFSYIKTIILKFLTAAI